MAFGFVFVYLVVYFLSFSKFHCQLKWQKIDIRTSRPSPRKFAVGGFDAERNLFIIFGGQGKDNVDFNDIWLLDYFTGEWYESNANRGVAPSPRHGSSGAVWSGKFYIFGGCSSKLCFDDIWAFDVGSFSWTIVPQSSPKPSGRGFAAFGLYPDSDSFVVSGGFGYNEEFFGDTYVFDFVKNRWFAVLLPFLVESWQSAYDPSVPHPRAYHASVMIRKTQLIIMGGCMRHGPCPSSDSWVFDINSKRWSLLSFCYPARDSASMAVLKTENDVAEFVILYGGRSKSRQIIGIVHEATNDELAVFDLHKNAWSIRRAEGQLPVQRFGSVLTSSRHGLFLFGGESSTGTLMNDLFLLSGNASKAEIGGNCKRSTFTLISLHGLFMFLGFAVLLQSGAAIAQFGFIGGIAEEKLNWRYVHKFLQIAGFLLAFCGFVCGIACITEGPHFQSVHGGSGLFLFLLLIVQAFMGFISRKFTALSVLILCIHYWNGALLLLMAIINISLGLFLAASHVIVWALWFVYIFLYLAVLCLLHSGVFARKPKVVQIETDAHQL